MSVPVGTVALAFSMLTEVNKLIAQLRRDGQMSPEEEAEFRRDAEAAADGWDSAFQRYKERLLEPHAPIGGGSDK